jgi:hypothetical protein
MGMSLFTKITDLLKPAPREDPMGYWVFVECARCGEKLRSRIHLHNDLSVRYGKTRRYDTYITQKTIIGSGTCFQPIELTLTFDDQRKVVGREITGGRFITEEEYASE